LNIIYLPQKFNNTKQIYRAISSTNALGCSISMPFKESFMKYIRPANNFVKNIGSVNTIINNGNYLKGYNTDALGANDVLKNIKFKNTLILGNGGVSKALIITLKKLKKNIFITGRNKNKVDKISKLYKIKILRKKEIRNIELIINATPIVNRDIFLKYIHKDICTNAKFFFDLNVDLIDNNLVRYFKSLNKMTISGFEMYINQVKYQFRLYTKKKISLKEIKKVFKLNSKLLQKKLK
jgi:shikimate dehydrogenase